VNGGKVPEAHITVVGAPTNPLTHAMLHTVVSAIVAPVSPVQAAGDAFATSVGMVHVVATDDAPASSDGDGAPASSDGDGAPASSDGDGALHEKSGMSENSGASAAHDTDDGEAAKLGAHATVHTAKLAIVGTARHAKVGMV